MPVVNVEAEALEALRAAARNGFEQARIELMNAVQTGLMQMKNEAKADILAGVAALLEDKRANQDAASVHRWNLGEALRYATDYHRGNPVEPAIVIATAEAFMTFLKQPVPTGT